jgi:hypothetical protein
LAQAAEGGGVNGVLPTAAVPGLVVVEERPLARRWFGVRRSHDEHGFKLAAREIQAFAQAAAEHAHEDALAGPVAVGTHEGHEAVLGQVAGLHQHLGSRRVEDAQFDKVVQQPVAGEEDGGADVAAREEALGRVLEPVDESGVVREVAVPRG